MPILIRGDRLLPETQTEVLGAFVYRWTVENEERARGWAVAQVRHAKRMRKYARPTQTDAEWLKSHAFYVNRDGRLTARMQAQHADLAPAPLCACCGAYIRPQDHANPIPDAAAFHCDMCAQVCVQDGAG